MEENKINEAVADTYIEENEEGKEKEIAANIQDTEDLNALFTVRPLKSHELTAKTNIEPPKEPQRDTVPVKIKIKEGDKKVETMVNVSVIKEESIPDETKIYKEEDLSFHVEGFETSASGKGAHAEGDSTKAIGQSAHAEGTSTRAVGFSAHAEGVATYARENGSHSEGIKTKALKDCAHAEGNRTTAEGFAAHAEGFKTIADAFSAHAEGYNTSTKGLEGAHIMGKFGHATHPNSWHLANGISDEYKSIGARIQSDGIGVFDLGVTLGNRGYAELFETLDGQPIEPGYFVTLEGSKIRKANRKDDFILGVTSANAGIIGNAGDLCWKHKYETDEWGKVKYRTILIPPVLNEEGYEIFPEHYELQPQLNPEWDSSQEYIPRLKRPEWVPVVIHGCVLVRDDGTCKVNGCCKCNNGGFATSANKGARVLERISENQILIAIY